MDKLNRSSDDYKAVPLKTVSYNREEGEKL
jgi:hypothetical protein